VRLYLIVLLLLSCCGLALSNDTTAIRDSIIQKKLIASLGVKFMTYSTVTQSKINLRLPTSTFKSYTTVARVPAYRTINGYPLTSNITIASVSTATSLAANGTNCGAGQAPLGVDASGNVEGCFTPSGTYSLPITDSVSTTSSTTAASATAVKAANDNANLKAPIASPAFTGTATANILNITSTLSGTSPIAQWIGPTLNATNNGLFAAVAYAPTMSLASGKTATVVASQLFFAPTIANSGTITSAATLYINGAPTVTGTAPANPPNAITVAGGNVYFGGTLTVASGGSTNKAVCWKSTGTLGYCSTVVAADGSCTCN